MILSGALQIDPTEHAVAAASLSERLADLDRRRRAAEATVESLLATWHGEASTAFRTQWEAWSGAASSVVDELASGVTALGAARTDLVGADERTGTGAARLEGRLG